MFRKKPNSNALKMYVRYSRTYINHQPGNPHHDIKHAIVHVQLFQNPILHYVSNIIEEQRTAILFAAA